MKKNLIIGLAIVLVVGGGLGAIKTNQIRTMIAGGAKMAPTPETVATGVVTEEKWLDMIAAVGSVSPFQGVTVAPEIAGTITEIAFESGATVSKGDLLLKLDTSSEEAQLQAAEAQVDLAQLNAERTRKLRENNTVSQAEADAVEATLKQARANAAGIQAVIKKKNIRAPFAGRLGIRLVNLGEQLAVGRGIVSLQSLSPVFVDFSLPQQELSRIQPGMTVRAFCDSYGEQPFTGELAAINPDLDPVTRNVRVRAKFENTNELLRAGMFVRVEVVLPGEKPVLVIKSTAILRAPYSDSVFVVLPEVKNGKTNLMVQQKLITTSRQRGDYTVVEEGLKAGDRVATEGVFKLRSGMSIAENNDLVPKASQTPNPPNS
jgi:membrane fusion protein (multidrug efflux system)